MGKMDYLILTICSMVIFLIFTSPTVKWGKVKQLQSHKFAFSKAISLYFLVLIVTVVIYWENMFFGRAMVIVPLALLTYLYSTKHGSSND